MFKMTKIWVYHHYDSPPPAAHHHLPPARNIVMLRPQLRTANGELYFAEKGVWTPQNAAKLRIS
jgi:hypothetical protein